MSTATSIASVDGGIPGSPSATRGKISASFVSGSALALTARQWREELPLWDLSARIRRTRVVLPRLGGDVQGEERAGEARQRVAELRSEGQRLRVRHGRPAPAFVVKRHVATQVQNTCCAQGFMTSTQSIDRSLSGSQSLISGHMPVRPGRGCITPGPGSSSLTQFRVSVASEPHPFPVH